MLFKAHANKSSSRLLQSLGLKYAPVIFPGTSAYHINGGTNPSAFDYFPRNNGSFFSAQADALTSMSVKPLFIFNAMFDEVNEGKFLAQDIHHFIRDSYLTDP